MNLLQSLLEADGGRLVGQLARRFGVDDTQAGAARKRHRAATPVAR